MAINVSRDRSKSKKPKLVIDLDNGDLKAIDEVIKKWKFRDEVSFLRFALAVMLKAENNTLKITDNDGVKRSLEPADELLVDEGEEPDGTTSSK